MNLFHTHYFQPSDDPEILYCRCGKTKDIHRHEWGDHGKQTIGERTVAILLKCKKCGDLKNHWNHD